MTLTASAMNKIVYFQYFDDCPITIPLICNFSFYNTSLYRAGDKVCLFRVGWTHVDQCLVTKAVTNAHQNYVTLLASELPKGGENCQYFQFCYLTEDNRVCNQSMHFRLYRPDDKSRVKERQQQRVSYCYDVEDRLESGGNSSGLATLAVNPFNTSVVTSEGMVRRQLDMKSKLIECRVESEIKSHNMSELQRDWKAREVVFMKQINEMKQQLTTTSEENTRLKESIEDNKSRVNVVMCELMACRVESKTKSEQNNALDKKLEKQSIMIKEQQSLIAKQSQDLKAGEELFAIQINELRQQLTTTSEENTRLKESIEDNKSSVDVLKSELMTCRVESETKSERNNALALSLEEMKKSKNDYKSRVESLERDVKALRDDNELFKFVENESLQSLLSREREVIILNGKTRAQQAVIDELNEKLSETESKAEEWKAREVAFVERINGMDRHLTTISKAFQKSSEENTRLKESIDEMKTKVKNYFENKDLMVRAETEVKAIIGSELGVEVLNSESVASDNTSIAKVSEEEEVVVIVVDADELDVEETGDIRYKCLKSISH